MIESSEKALGGQVHDAPEVGEEELAEGARRFELFWLRPSRCAGQEAVLRIRINSKFSGWRLKDELVESLGLTVGDTVNAEVSVLFGPDIIADSDDIDLFADGDAATWLLESIIESGSPEGCVLDVRVRFVYKEAPVGGPTGRSVGKASLVLIEGIRFVGSDGVPRQAEDGSPLDALAKWLNN